jgi:tRNA (guanine37-N1)-methyltransferase
MLRIDIVTLFPALFEPFLEVSFVGMAREKGTLDVRLHDLRDWASDRHRSVDDTPYGGGPGMLMTPEPLVPAIESLAGPKGPDRTAHVVAFSPQGGVLTQSRLAELAELTHLVLVCGRYEGIDDRVFELAVDEEISIGDFVLSGGDVPAMVLVEGLVRWLPDVLGNPESAQSDSFAGAGGGLLEGPQYTRPPIYRGVEVPEILRSGDHAAIARWRSERALERTRLRRPDLWSAHTADQAGAPADVDARGDDSRDRSGRKSSGTGNTHTGNKEE